ncbi:hypothetical protein DFH06DRAFT_1411112 [Mycena polygramma]|nr:hypothetical protein DFH06DRAFT_1411112 [Mycena polygramma]
MVESLLGMFALIMVATQFVAASPALITLANPPFLFPLNTDARSAAILGVDAQGRTTYAIDEYAEGGGTREVLTATLVQGADSATFTIGGALAIGYDCDFSGGSAVCVEVDDSFVPMTSTMALGSELVLDVPLTGSPSPSPSATGPTPSAQRAEDTSSSQKASASVFGALVGSALVTYGLI